MEFAGGGKEASEKRESSGEKLPRRRKSVQVRGRSRFRAQRRSCRSGRELRAGRQWRRRARSGGGRQRLGEGRGKGPPLWLIWAAGEGSGMRLRPCGSVWPSTQEDQPADRRKESWRGRRGMRRGGRGLRLHQVTRGSWVPAH